MRRVERFIAVGAASAVFACSGGGGGSGGSFSGFLGGNGNPDAPPVLQACDGFCDNMRLEPQQVMTIVQQAVNEANARNVGATIAVVDRVGNTLAIYEMDSAPQTITIGSNNGANNVDGPPLDFPGNGLEDIRGGAQFGSSDPTQATVPVPELGGMLAPVSARFAAISKAGTAAYLSTQGNAFTTRTASQIIQENFNPGEGNQASGPLFGVQFSQLPCGDIARKSPLIVPAQGMAGPKRLPLGFSGDAGGVPLYVNGDMVGAVGVEVDGVYSVDKSPADDDNAVEEIIAMAAQRSFEAPADREARGITVMGKQLRYVDPPSRNFLSPPLSQLATTVTGATLVDVTTVTGAPNFFSAAGGVLTGTRFLSAESGYLKLPAAGGGYFMSGLESRILVTPDAMPYLGQNLVDPSTTGPETLVPVAGPVMNPRPSLSPQVSQGGLTAQEAGLIVASGIRVAQQARAQIRRGVGGPGLPFMQVNVSVVDLAGNLIAFAGTSDAPVFGTTVSIQKARTAAFISRKRGGADPAMPTGAGDDLLADVAMDDPLGLGLGPDFVGRGFQSQSIPQYVLDLREFFRATGATAAGFPDFPESALNDGIAFSDRSGGLLSRPFFPDGTTSSVSDIRTRGPFSRPLATFSPFNNGLQLDLVINRLLVALLADPTLTSCTGPKLLEVRGGIQIFPGSVPIFKNGVLVGGMGISGDGVDQDDFIAFEGLKRAGAQIASLNGQSNPDGFGTPGFVGNAPLGQRSSNIRVPPLEGGAGGFLRYVNCPAAPFLVNNDMNVCEGQVAN